MSERAVIRVLFFARLRELVGCAELALSVPQQLSRQQLAALVAEQRPDVVGLMDALLAPNVRLALNEEVLGAEPGGFRDGDRLAFLPPVTGG